MSINEAITKAIQDNLPAATAGELKKYLDEAKKTHADYISLIDVAESRNAEIVRLNNKILQLESAAKTHGDLKEREKAVTILENNIKVTIAELKAGEAEKRANEIKELTALAFRNPIIKHHTINSEYGTNANGTYSNTTKCYTLNQEVE